jgi:hypothetical protein
MATLNDDEQVWEWEGVGNVGEMRKSRAIYCLPFLREWWSSLLSLLYAESTTDRVPHGLDHGRDVLRICAEKSDMGRELGSVIISSNKPKEDIGCEVESAD